MFVCMSFSTGDCWFPKVQPWTYIYIYIYICVYTDV